MNKNRFKIFSIVTLTLILIGAASFMLWRQRQIERLESHSSIIETAKGPIEYARIGEGPAVLVLHGTLGGYDQLQPLVEQLNTESYQFIFVSRPGYLRTPISTGETFEEQAGAYAALLDQLGIERVAVIAVSGGGPSALQFALRYPERCWGLVMLSANADVEAGKETGQNTESTGQPPEILTNILLSDFTSWVFTGASKLLPRQVLKGIVGEDYVDSVLDNDTKRGLYHEMINSLALLSRRRAGALNDGKQFLTFAGYPYKEITAPMLILHGTNDKAVNIAQPQYLNATVPDSEYIEIAGGTHFMLISHDEIISPLIVDFLDAHAP